MAHRSVHYEAALEDFLRAKGCPYVAVDEAKKAIFGASAVKSFDFLVYSATGPNLLVDVKGRKFPDRSGPGRRSHTRSWENWITREDIEGLRRWQEVFGRDFCATLVFAYWLQGPPHRAPFQDVHLFRGKHYAFLAVPLERYVAAARPRSARWQTVGVGSREFASLARDLSGCLADESPTVEEPA